MSDQDFFFDEDETPAAKAAPKASSKSAAAKPAPSRAKSAPAPASVGGIELTWTITALVGVVALLLGVIVGYAIPKSADIATPTTTQTQTSAPQLTPEELSSGQLPAGHPDISGATGATGTAAPSSTTTGN